MEIVVLNSDIARLVLDYLKSQKLKRATHTFCKTSPYLKQEFNAYKQGLQTHSFFPELKEIICEYVTISRKVEQLLPKLCHTLRIQCHHRKLSDKVADIIDSAMQIILSYHGDQLASSTRAPDDIAVVDKFCAVLQTGSSISSDKENNNNIKLPETTRKRPRSVSVNISSNDEQLPDANAKTVTACSRLTQPAKKSRTLEPYCFLNTKALQRHKLQHNLRRSHRTIGEKDGENAEEDKDWMTSSNEELIAETDEDDVEDEYEEENEADIFDSGRPTKESTPRRKFLKVNAIAPEFSQAILENPEFQQRLVENINQALANSNTLRPSVHEAITTPGPTATTANTNQTIKDTSMISSSQLLDQMIKNIMDITEKDPSFDAIIKEVVEASNKPLVQSTAVQCDITPSTPVNSIQDRLPNSSCTVEDPTHVVPSRPLLLPASAQIPQQQDKALQVTSAINAINVNTTNAPAPPRTPLIIRTALAATDASVLSTTNAAQDLINIDTNNSFGSLIDPNFSISKLIVLNQTESAKKQQSDATIGNTTAENIISQLSSGQLTAGETITTDEQVYYDPYSGQLTFPVYLTNDGLIANFPFVVNNDAIAQHLQSNNLSNLDASCEEIPPPEPIKIAPDQLPQNTIILESSGKTNNPQDPVSQQTSEKAANVDESNKSNCSTAPPTSSESVETDKVTPSASGIVNTKAYKSLSTPRKRTSHVRTLTFSPRIGTPLSTRRDTVFSRFQEVVIPSTNSASTKENLDATKESEVPIIKNVIILPTLSAPNDTLKDVSSASANETAHSGNVPPLFVTEENSNQTVINKHIPVIKDAVKNVIESTPKKPQIRKSAARSCKRQITKSQPNQDPAEEKGEKENDKNIPPPGTQEYHDYMMEQWNLQLNCSGGDFDVRLRELNAKMTHLKPVKKVLTKKRVRRKKPAATKRKEKELAEEAEELEMARLLEVERGLQSTETKSEDEEELNKDNDICQVASNVKKQNSNNTIKKSDEISKTTPQKPTFDETDMAKKEKFKECSNDGRDNDNGGKQNDSVQIEIVEPAPEDKGKLENKSCTPGFPLPAAENPDNYNPLIPTTHLNVDLEREKRTSNIAFLLETPLKSMDISTSIPPTPGIFAPTMETPVGKSRGPHDDMHASASFLFGSLTKSELDTPMFNAITPGFRFPPFGSKEVATPRSATATECSSGGGSYYKPDENEDLDRNIDKILRNSAQKKLHQKKSKETDKAEGYHILEEGEIPSDEMEVEIAIKTLKVEPIVLKRIKSFSTEEVESVEGGKIDPHYTLASGLPEISAAEDESSSSSSSSSSSPSSSSNSSSSSSSSSPASNATAMPQNELEVKAPVNANLELEQLSEISSTEDEEWMRLAVSDNNENSLLVNNDGEVRYPVRSWLTPIKENTLVEPSTFALEPSSPTQSTMKMTLSLKSAEKRIRQVKELEQKRERLKEKLKNDASTIAKKEKPTSSTSTAPNISQALATTRVMYAMRDKGKKAACIDNMQCSNASEVATDNRSIDVLTALNLSAKKQTPTTPEADTSKIRSNLFNLPSTAKQKTDTAKTSEKIENPKVDISSPSSKTPIRKCMPIEARPVTKTIRKATKKIVRTPLAFKSMDKVNAETLPKVAMKPAELATSPLVQAQAVRVSPRLMKPKKNRAKKTEETPTKNTKANTRSAKGKSIPTNSNAKKKENPKKPAKAKVNKTENEPKEKKSIEADKHITEEEQTQSVASPLCHVKPKINVKAGKKMTLTKIKNKSDKPDERDLIQATAGAEIKAEQKETATSEISEDEHLLNQISTTPTPAVITTIVSEAGPIEDTSDDDPLEQCELTAIDESDAQRFVHCIYEGTDQPSQVIAHNPDFANFQMVVAIDENEKHVWTVTEGICLYSCAPASDTEVSTKKKQVQQSIRNIPRKRKVHVTSSSSEDKLNKQTSAQLVTNVTKKIAPASLKAFTTAANPGATSTPVLQQETKIERAIIKEGPHKNTKTHEMQKTSVECSTNLPADDTKPDEPKIQIEDIESILSHLHGT